MITTAPAVTRPQPITAGLQAPAEHIFKRSSSDPFANNGRREAAFGAGFEPAFGLAPGVGSWVAQMLDQVDYAMLLVSDDGKIIHMNAATRAALGASHPLTLENGALRARAAENRAPLLRAIDGAARRGLHSLVTLRGAGTTQVSVAVVPLRACSAADGHVALVILGRKSMGEDLTAQWFGRCHGLTPAESRVLGLLCQGLLPSEVADRQGVASSTVRTQIANIREKTGSGSIRALLCRIALLPPLVGALSGQVT